MDMNTALKDLHKKGGRNFSFSGGDFGMTDLKHIIIRYSPPEVTSVIKGESVKDVFDKAMITLQIWLDNERRK